MKLQPNTSNTIMTMAPKKSTEIRKLNALKVREALGFPDTQSDPENVLAISQENLASAKMQVTLHELAVENFQATCARLLKDLDAANSKIADLNLALKAEHEHSERLYRSLRVEHHTWQHADKRKQVLSGTIAKLRKTTEHRDSAAKAKRA